MFETVPCILAPESNSTAAQRDTHKIDYALSSQTSLVYSQKGQMSFFTASECREATRYRDITRERDIKGCRKMMFISMLSTYHKSRIIVETSKSQTCRQKTRHQNHQSPHPWPRRHLKKHLREDRKWEAVENQSDHRWQRPQDRQHHHVFS